MLEVEEYSKPERSLQVVALWQVGKGKWREGRRGDGMRERERGQSERRDGGKGGEGRGREREGGQRSREERGGDNWIGSRERKEKREEG